MKRVVVIGGGIGGVEVARTLSEKGVPVTLVTEKDYYISGPSRPLVLSNEQSLDRIIRGYNHLPENVEVVYGRVVEVDPEERKAKFSDGRSLDYDYLVISAGLRYDYSALSLEDKIYNVYDIGKLYDLKQLVWSVKSGSFVVYAPRQPYRCAPAPGETVMTIDMVLRHRGVRDDVELYFVDANPKFQPPVIHDVWKSRFEDAGIEYVIGKEIVKLEKDGVVLSDGEKIKVDYKVILPPNRAINLIKGRDGFIEVRSPQDLRTKDYDDVFAVGDAAKLPYPKNSEVTSTSARIAASQILEDLGLGEKVELRYRFVGWAYAGNLEGKLSTQSIKFELEFTPEGPKGSKDPEPKEEYTKQKDVWEQGVLRKLFGY